MDNVDKISGLNVSRETLEEIKGFIQELLKWNKAINLVSKRTISDDLFNRHIVDSLQLSPFIEGESFADVGSGGGLPAIILAIACKSKVCLIESDKRKVAFLNHIIAMFNLDCRVSASRVEQTKIDNDLITSRAFASIEKTFELISQSNDIATKQLLLLKGESYLHEIEEAQKKWLFNFKKIDSITNSRSKVIIINNISKK